MSNSVKIGIVGTGKTGSFVKTLIENHHIFQVGECFNSQNPLTLKKMESLHGLIIFVNADVLTQIMPILMKSTLPIVCGTTGFNYQLYAEDLKLRRMPFIYGSNYSMGVHVVRKMLENLKKAKSLFSNYQFELKETHHTKKLDKPSGTAKSISEWVAENIAIQSIRIGDVVGHHELTFHTEFETIKISHEAHSREVFAQGAIQVMEQILKQPLPQYFLSVDEFLDSTIF